MRGFVVAFVMVVAVFAAYAGVRHNGFVKYDDHSYITENPHTLKGLTSDNVHYAFTSFDTGNWHPLTWLSLMLDWHIFGDRPAWHHFENVLWHAINSLLLLAALSRMTASFWPSAVVALLWAVHPLRVESVAWASERKDLLSAFFGFLCLMAYARYVLAPSFARYIPVALTLALGLLCKPMLVTWPCVLLLLDFWPLRRVHGWSEGLSFEKPSYSLVRIVLEKVPLLLIVVASSVVTVIAQHSVGAVASTDAFPLSSRIANSVVTVARYLGGTFWPSDLAVLYPYVVRWPTMLVAGAGLLLLVITIGSILLRRRMPWVLMGWLWFLGTLMPVIGLVQVGVQAMADRYTYLPQIGVLIAVVFTAWAIVQRRTKAMLFVTMAIAIPLWLQTRHQVTFWRDSEALYRRALAVTKENWIMQNNVGGMLMERQDYAGAATHYAEAARIAPFEPDPAQGLADALFAKGELAAAIPAYERALSLKTDNTSAFNNLAWILATAPPPLRNGELAVKCAARACELAGPASPDFPSYLDTLGAALAAANRFPEAVQAAQRAIQVANIAGDRELAQQIETRLQRYRNNQLAE